jgi:hypothetical protein
MFPAKAQRRKAVLGFSSAPLRLCGKKIFAIAIALSFFTTLVPVAAAFVDSSTTMACCVGKTAGHCDSGIPVKKLPDPRDPMCGLDSGKMEDDGITIVAEPAHTESHQTSESAPAGPAVQSPSLSQPCQMDCGACVTASTRQQKRDRGVVQTTTHQSSPLTTLSIYEDLTVLFSANLNWEQTAPRGPPANLR